MKKNNFAVAIGHILFIFFILLSFSVSLVAKADKGNCVLNPEGKITSLSGTWYFRYGDDISWKDDRFSPSEWQSAEVPGWIASPSGKQKPGFFWYRLHIDIKKKTLRDQPLFISLPRFFHASEVYFNGQRIGSRGKLPVKTDPFVWGVGGIYRIINSEHIRFDSPNVLTVRTYGGYPFFAGSLYSYGFIGPYDHQKSFYWINNLMNLILGGFLLLFAIRAFLRYRTTKNSNLFHLGVFSFFLGIFFLVVWMPDNIDGNTQLLHKLQVAFLLGVLVSLLVLGRDIKTLPVSGKQFVRGAVILYSILAIIIFSTNYFPLINGLLYGSLLIILIYFFIVGIAAFINTIRGKRNQTFFALGTFLVITAMIMDLWRATGGGTAIGTYVIRLVTPIAALIFIVFIYRYLSLGEIVDNKKQKYHRSQLKGVDTESLEVNIGRLMTEEKVYRSDTLTLQHLAELLDISIHQLSEYLNRNLKQNFNNYINFHRIVEAKEMIISEPEASILSIAYHVGFNSVSTFYDAFKREIGQKPQEFRKSNSSK